MLKELIMKLLKNMTKKQKILVSIISITIVAAIITTSVVLITRNNNKEPNTQVVDNMNDTSEDSEEEEETHIQVIPIVNTPYGMQTESKLKLISRVPMKEEDIKKNLSFSPNKKYKVETVSDKEFIISVNTPFENNQIVKVMYNTEQEKLGWAFQTIKKFGIASTHPANKAYNVPIDTGIELHFNKTITPKELDNYFDIQPTVKGKFVYESNKIIFVPDKELEKGIDYTITIKKGYSNGLETLINDYTFTFRTDGYRYSSERIDLYGTSQYITYFKPEEPQILSCYTSGVDENEVDLTIYKFISKDDFIKGYNVHNESNLEDFISTIKSSEKYTYTSKCERYSYNRYIELQNLEEGYYFLTAKYKKSMDYMFIQVSPYNAYTAVDKDKLLVWMVDGKSGNVVKDAKIVINNENLGQTDNEGFALIHKKLEQHNNSLIELYVDGENPLLVPVFIDDYYENSNTLYWSYIYFDRGLYLPTDEINVFGFVQKRNGEDVNTVKVQLLNENNVIMEEREVTLSQIGTYQTKFQIDNYLHSYVNIHVIVDDKKVESRYINIARFEKPTYKIDASMDKDFIMMGDSVTLTADVNFYEGTPAAYSNIEVKSYNYDLFGKGTTSNKIFDCNDKGHKEVTLTPYKDTNEWQPRYCNIYTEFIDLQKNYISAISSIIVFPRDTMVEITNNKISDSEVEVTASLSQVDTNNFKGKLYDYDSYRGIGVQSREVNIEIVEHYYEKVYEGKGYDFINKISYDKYRYEHHKDTVKSITDYTDENGKLTFNYSSIKPHRGYEVILRTKDSKDRQIKQSSYYSKAVYTKENEAYLERYSLSMNQSTFKQDAIMGVDIQQGYSDIPSREKDKALIFICQDGIMDYVITDETSIDLTYLDKYIPNAYLYAVYFDGKSLHKDYSMKRYFSYDYDDEELKINIETDKKDYRPGEKVKTTIIVTDKDNNPVVADVNISVVNEAFFAICEDNTNVLQKLYRGVFSSGIIGEFLAAYNIYYEGGGAECGGEGDADFIRSNFKNTADFMTIKTGEDGIGFGEFQLPDNLTSWRITCTALDKHLRAGKDKYNVNAKLPFFISSIIYDSYMVGDTIHATIKTAGAELSKDDLVEFTGVIEKEDGEIIEVKQTGQGHAYVNIPIGKLPEGKHKVTVIAKTGEYKDGEQYNLEVTDTLHYFDVIKKEDLTEDIEIISNDQYVHLDFFNKDICDYYCGLLNIYNGRNSRRSDYLIASYLAGRELNKQFGKAYSLDFENSFMDYMSYQGLYKPFTYGDESAEITANIISIGYIENKDKIINGLLQEARNKDKTAAENIAALWGLTMLGEPVLLDVTSIYNDYKYVYETLSFEKMYMMLTFIENGDLEKGKEIYNDAKERYMKKHYEQLYMEDKEAGAKFTAMMMVAAIKLELLEEAKGMYAYLTALNDEKYPTITERLYYLQHIKPVKDTCDFEYELDGKKEKVTLGHTYYYSLDLTPEQASNIKFSKIEGNVRVVKDFIGTIKDIQKADKYSIERWYTPDLSDTEAKQGEIVTVHIKVKVYDNRLSSFILEDILPTGLTYLGEGKINGEHNYVWFDNEARQTKINAYIYKRYDEADTYSFEITYKAKAVLAGEYTSEPIIIRDYVNDDISYSDEGVIIIN
jgi:hypothetical protein